MHSYFQWVNCVIIYGFTISNPSQEMQHVEIVPIIFGLASHMLQNTFQRNNKAGYFETNETKVITETSLLKRYTRRTASSEKVQNY